MIKWQKKKVAYLQVRFLVFRASELSHDLKKLVQERTPAALGHAGLCCAHPDLGWGKHEICPKYMKL